MSDVRILGVRLTSQTYSAGTTRLLEAAANHQPFRAHFCTVHSLVEASREPLLADVFESSDMVAMDGMPLVWVARHRGRRTAERVCGPDMMLTILDEGRRYGLRHFFLGGAPGVPEALGVHHPGLVLTVLGELLAERQLAQPVHEQPLREPARDELVLGLDVELEDDAHPVHRRPLRVGDLPLDPLRWAALLALSGGGLDALEEPPEGVARLEVIEPPKIAGARESR